MRPTVLLFDIDGTLVSTDGAGRRALARAFERRAGRGDAVSALNFGGMTDRAIVRAGLTFIGRDATEAEIDAVLGLYLEGLEAEVAGAQNARVHPGVNDLLDALEGRPGVAVGLGTGNIRAGARVKLGRFALHDRFSFGGFGCDHELRDELLRIGAARGAAALGASLSTCRVVVIGDTPRDIAAAKAIGAESLAVSTGAADHEALAERAPTHLFADLAAPGVLDALVG